MRPITELEPAPQVAPSKIRVHGIAFAEGVRMFLDVRNWKLGEDVEHVVPKLTIDYDHSVTKITRKTVSEFTYLFPEGMPWSDLPKVAIDSTASINGVHDLGIQGYSEMLASVAITQAARLEIRRMATGFTRFRLKVKGRAKPFELLLPSQLLAPFLAQPAQI